MKRIFFTLAVLSLLAFTACRSKNNNQFQVVTPPPQQQTGNTQSLPPDHPPINAQGGQSGQTDQSSGNAGNQMGGQQGGIAPPPAVPDNGALDLAGLEKAMPKGWEKTPPASNMRLAQFKLPKSGGDTEDGELVVFYFGPSAGTVDANIQRWESQFADARDKNTSKFTTASKLNVTVAEVAGTLNTSSMMGGGNASKSNYRLYAAIVESPTGPFFFKATGPEKTIKAQRDAIKGWLMKAKLVAAH